jgi:aryl-alcohol dehydrogenase-like predicted oxidoreductase
MPALRTLGPWSVFPIGLGCMNVSWPGGAAVDPPRREGSATPGIHAGLDAGVTFLDTADIYAPAWDQVGHNETFVAEALSSWQGDPAQKSTVLIATKGGITRSDGEKWGRQANLEYLVGAAERSRDRLGVDVIDLWQHHRLDPSIPFETQFENVLELKSRGIVKEIGVSNYNAAQVTTALKIGGGPGEGGLISVQNEFSPMYRHDEEVLALCEDAGVAFLPWSPLGGSKKVNRITAGEAGGFVEMAAAKGVSPEALVLAWLLAYSPVIIPIPGATRPGTIRDSVSAAEITLSGDERDALTASLPESLARSEELEPSPPFRS